MQSTNRAAVVGWFVDCYLCSVGLLRFVKIVLCIPFYLIHSPDAAFWGWGQISGRMNILGWAPRWMSSSLVIHANGGTILGKSEILAPNMCPTNTTLLYESFNKTGEVTKISGYAQRFVLTLWSGVLGFKVKVFGVLGCRVCGLRFRSKKSNGSAQEFEGRNWPVSASL